MAKVKDPTSSLRAIEDGSSLGEENVNLFTEDPILLSQFLALQAPINEGIIKTFQDKAAAIGGQEKMSPRDRKWLNDYCAYHSKLYTVPKVGNRSSVRGSSLAEGSNRAVFEEPRFPPPTTNVQAQANRAIKLNELVKKPECFDGYKPPARKWIDDYEKASEANEWSEVLMVEYFPTFLEKAANDRFVAVAKRKLGSHPSWQDLRAAFIRHYLGDSDRQVLRRQIERTCQGEKEKATNFIPRFMRLVDPNKPEEELVDLLRSKLREV